jgi:hypothetical protein
MKHGQQKHHLEAIHLEILRKDPDKNTVELLEQAFHEETRLFNEIFNIAYDDFIKKTRKEIKTLPKSTKKWWRLNRTLLGRAAKKSASIPPLTKFRGRMDLGKQRKSESARNNF